MEGERAQADKLNGLLRLSADLPCLHRGRLGKGHTPREARHCCPHMPKTHMATKQAITMHSQTLHALKAKPDGAAQSPRRVHVFSGFNKSPGRNFTRHRMKLTYYPVLLNKTTPFNTIF